MHKVELLAPAGNFECMIAAVQSGADAVYLAGTKFGARSFADNFDEGSLERAVDYCHVRGVKVYVTVNTLVLDDETDELCKYLKFLSQIGVDAIIVQDLGVLELAKRFVPNLPVHASTQMTICNSEGVKILKKYGVKRVVLARELSIGEIEEISKNTDSELEVFAHGALCMCYSGQCLLSSIIGSRSGNRGKCAQPCRLPYSINKEKRKAFFMSLKDLSSLEHLEKLKTAGVASLKIEGRMKGPLYVAAVVGVYRKYIDNPQKISDEDIKLLDAIFNRGGLTDGYLTGKTGKEMFALDKPDNPYRKNNSDIERLLSASINGENRKTKIAGEIIISEYSNPIMKISYSNVKVEYEHNLLPEKAVKSELDATTVMTQMRKTGGTPYEFESLDAEVETGLFLSAGELNKIRRNALEKFEKALIDSFKRKETFVSEPEIDSECENVPCGYVCEVTNAEQLRMVKKYNFDKFYVPLEIIKNNPELAADAKEKTIVVLPAILREKDFDKCIADVKKLVKSGYKDVLTHSFSVMEKLSECNLYGGFRLNVFNSIALKGIKDMGFKTVELSPELTLRQIKEIKKIMPVQVMIYGRLPLMVSENCIIRNGENCPCKGENSLTDRMGMTFPVIKDGESCRSIVLNCKKTFMLNEIEKIKRAGVSSQRVYFSDESAEECGKICDALFFETGYTPEDFTKGHFYKGVSK